MPDDVRWHEIQPQLLLAAEWGTQIAQLDTAIHELLHEEVTPAATAALEAATEARDLAVQLANWPDSEVSTTLVSTAEHLRDALKRTATMLGATEAMGGAKDELKDAFHGSLTYLHGSVEDFAAQVAALLAATRT